MEPEQAVRTDIMALRPGEWYTYHRGYLWIDRYKSRKANAISKMVRKLYDSGVCTMAQKRHGDMDYEYWAKRL